MALNNSTNLKEKLALLEKQARALEISAINREELLDKVEKHTENYLQDLEEAPAYYRSKKNASEPFNAPFLENSGSIEEILKILKEYVDEDGLNAASGGHLGYIPGGGIYTGALGDFLAAVTNRYAGVFFANPGAVRMENMLIRWMRDLVGFPFSTAGNLASGGSIANLTAIVTARDAHGLKGKDFEKTVVYLTEQAHHAVHKSLRIAGLGEVIHRNIPMDDHFRMDSDALEKQIRKDKDQGLYPWMIVVSAGTTDTGAVDPILGVSKIAKEHNMWLHIDAAYGGFFLLSETGRDKIQGMEKADSIVMDPHKGLFLPYGLGAVLVKNGERLYQSHYYKANYMQDSLHASDEPSPSELSPELTKHFRGLRMWLSLKLFGLKPFRAALEEKLQLARYFYEKLQEMEGWETGPYPDLSVVLFRFVPENTDPDKFNAELIHRIQHSGRVFMSSTTVNDKFYLRVAILSFRTHKKTLDIALAELNKHKQAILEER